MTGSSGSSDDSYGYDANGNPNTTGYTVGTGNELTNSPGVTYTYDNDGNMITATTESGTTTYTYDYENRLTNVEIDGTMVATYTYDALGRRIGIEDSCTQTWTVFNGSSPDANPYADFNSSGDLQMRYLDGLAVDEIFARTDSTGDTSWYLTDQVGSVLAIASTSAFLDEITYDPFGNIVTQTDASEADRFMFAGMEYDPTTGLYYDHARYYDAAIGRFCEQDPMGFAAEDTNLYRYVGNDPTARVDTSGMDDRWDKLFPADLWIPTGLPIPTGQWWYQTGVGSHQYPITKTGLIHRVDGMYTTGGYLKIPTGTTVIIAGPLPGGNLLLYTDGDLEWYPITIQNPQGDNPAAGESGGANWAKKKSGPNNHQQDGAPIAK